MASPAWMVPDAYERYVGRWSRLVAREFLTWLDAPADRTWIDVGCGTGALTAQVLAAAAPVRVVGLDPSPGFLGAARRGPADPRRHHALADARALPLRSGSVDVAVSGLAINFVPEPHRAVAELARVVRTGGVVAAYVWDYHGGMAMMRHFWGAAGALDPEAAALDEGARFTMCRPETLRTLWTDAGLTGVATTAVEVPTVFADFDDYWQPFLGGQGPAPGYVAALPEPARTRLRERLRADLPTGADGTIALTARAWAVRGTVTARA